MSFDPAELSNWLASRHARDVACPICRSDEWVYGNFKAGLPRITNHQPDLTKGYEVAALVCRNCGFVRLHAPEALTPGAPFGTVPDAGKGGPSATPEEPHPDEA